MAPSASAATISVTTQADVVASSDGTCSLREAVIAANTNTAGGATAGDRTHQFGDNFRGCGGLQAHRSASS